MKDFYGIPHKEKSKGPAPRTEFPREFKWHSCEGPWGQPSAAIEAVAKQVMRYVQSHPDYVPFGELSVTLEPTDKPFIYNVKVRRR